MVEGENNKSAQSGDANVFSVAKDPGPGRAGRGGRIGAVVGDGDSPVGGLVHHTDPLEGFGVLSQEASKSGLHPAEVLTVAQAVAALPRVRLRGLMAIPEAAAGEPAQRAPHRALRELLGALNDIGLALDTLSMGMSADLEAAVAEGATLLRVGTAIFGGR